MIVVANKAVTVSVEITDSAIERDCVTQLVTSMEYLIVAIDAPVIGNVYAHHASENLNPRKKLILTA